MKNKKKLLLLLILVIILAGCTKITDSNNQVLAEKIISLETPWGGGWFDRFFVWPIAQLINILDTYLHTGATIAILLASGLVKLLTLVLTLRSTIATQKMQALQPELEKITRKYADKKNDRNAQAMMAQEQNALYAKHGINPLGMLLVTFIQFPIFIAVYQAVVRASSVVNGSIFGHPLNVSPSSGIANGQWLYLVIFVIMGISQFLSMKIPTWLQERKRKRKAYEEKPKNPMNGMVYGMLVMILFLGFTWPIGMSLYWTINSIIQILQTLFIQSYIEKKGV